MKRFYKLTSTAQEAGGWTICLDGRPVKTPSKATLLVQNEALAQEIAQEWAQQGEEIVPDTMPLMQIATTRQDAVRINRADMESEILKFTDTDLLCYQTDEPEDLASVQKNVWGESLDWFFVHYGVRPAVTTALGKISQEPAYHDAIASYVEALDDARFTVLQIIVPMSGSIILAMRFCEGDITPQELLAAARLEENWRGALYYEELHGRDPIEEKRQDAMLRDLKACARYLELL